MASQHAGTEPTLTARRRIKQTNFDEMPSTGTTLSARERSAARSGLVRGRTGSRRVSGVRRAFGHRRPVLTGWRLSAGVAQLVERQPSKLNVASSNLVSRSVIFLDFGAPAPKSVPVLASSCAGVPVLVSSCAGVPVLASSCAGGFGASAPKSVWAPGAPRAGRRAGRLCCFAHLAQLVEHVLGKDEVTSSILVVGSKRLWKAASSEACLPRRFAVAAACSGAGVTTEFATHQ